MHDPSPDTPGPVFFQNNYILNIIIHGCISNDTAKTDQFFPIIKTN